MKAEHPIDEWEKLKNLPLPDTYDNKDNFRLTKCTATLTGFDDVTLKFNKTKKQMLIKFKGFVEKNSTKYCHKETEEFVYLFERLSHKERVMLGKFLLED